MQMRKINKVILFIAAVGLAVGAKAIEMAWTHHSGDVEQARAEGYAAGFAQADLKWRTSVEPVWEDLNPLGDMVLTAENFAIKTDPCDPHNYSNLSGPPLGCCWENKAMLGLEVEVTCRKSKRDVIRDPS